MKQDATVIRPGLGITFATVAAFLAVAGTATIGAQQAVAQSYEYMSCNQLWYARNEIFARHGHCFQTQRGRSAFGRGCFPPYGQLRGWEAREVARIKRWENRKGCR